MAEKSIKTKIFLRNDTKQNWKNTNPVLGKGEMGIEIDTKKFKFGDGVTNWNSLKYAETENTVLKEEDPTTNDDTYAVGTHWINTAQKKIFICLEKSSSSSVWKQIALTDSIKDLGVGDMLKSDFATGEKAGQGYVDKAVMSDSANVSNKLKNPQNIVLSGDATGTTEFDGSSEANILVSLKNSGVSAGTYTKVTVDEKGIVTSAENITESDLPEISIDKITGGGTILDKNTGTNEGDIPIIGAGGKLDESILPSIAITDVFEASSQGEMLALSQAEKGDICIRSDENKTYVLKQNPYSVLENWIELRTPTGAVLSVNGKTGAVILTTENISEQNNLYYTDERADSNFNKNFAKKSASELTDSDDLMRYSDTITIDGGNA